VRIFFFLLFVLLELNVYPNTSPKNIIIMIGDGMGVSYVSASVLSLKNDSFRRFTTTGFSVTCSADNLITDSAAGATAIATGYRTNNYFISLNPETEKPLFTILELAEKLNKSTGLVVTCSVTHATPGAFVSHVKNRSMEIDIAKQISEMDLEVVIGGGTKFFIPKSAGGDRTDGANLITAIKDKGYSYFNNYNDLKKYNSENNFYALLDANGLPKAADRDYTLSDLVKTALKKLNQDKDGFVLMIEGSQIDWSGHQNNQDYLLSEMKDFNTAINTVLDFAEQDGETLVVLTADHETGGMGIIEGDKDGCNLELDFLTNEHTPSMVGLFAKGKGEDEFRGILDNYIIGRKLFKLLDNSYQF
jgi:alkaline phosphatase